MAEVGCERSNSNPYTSRINKSIIYHTCHGFDDVSQHCPSKPRNAVSLNIAIATPLRTPQNWVMDSGAFYDLTSDLENLAIHSE